MKTKIGTAVRTRARGKKTMYAPMTPAMAPLAPTMGMSGSPWARDSSVCAAAAAMPLAR